jgi:RimJ/RimL family protein N-acetyltransferase
MLRPMEDRIIFETERLFARRAANLDIDVDFFYDLWTNPEVMKFVGFPAGLRITREQIRKQIEAENNSEYDKKLIVALKTSGQPIGECKLGSPDMAGISETDIKLLPQYWGQGYGSEIKAALVEYLFTHTNCTAVKATPNRLNIASQKMQESVGGKKVDEGTYHFPPHMRQYTTDVPYFVYMVFRDEWEKKLKKC